MAKLYFRTPIIDITKVIVFNLTSKNEKTWRSKLFHIYSSSYKNLNYSVNSIFSDYQKYLFILLLEVILRFQSKCPNNKKAKVEKEFFQLLTNRVVDAVLDENVLEMNYLVYRDQTYPCICVFNLWEKKDWDLKTCLPRHLRAQRLPIP